MSMSFPTAAEVAQRETSAAAGFALKELRACAPRAELLDDLRLVLRLESHRMGAIAESALRRLLKQLEAGEGASPLIWRPMTEKPSGNATAMIRCTDEECAALMPGPVAWSIAHQRWCYESSMHPIKLDRPGVTYHWCHEHEITGGRP